MSKEFEYLLHLLGCSIHSKKASTPPEGIDWEFLYRLAKEQTVYPILLYALKRQPELLESDGQAWVKRELRSILISETLRRDASDKLLSALENAGITPVVLKGYGLSHLYPEPTIRQSADLDIYVGLEQEQLAQHVLRTCGVHVKERAQEAQEGACYYDSVGCIELHAWLMGKDDRLAWMKENPSGITQPFKKIEIEDGKHIYILGDEDNMLFLTLHFIKHFVKYGANLRNLFDVLLFYRYYSQSNNCEKFWAKMKELRFDGLVRAMITCGVMYGSFTCDELPVLEPSSKSIVLHILSDIENGGWMGQKESDDRNITRLIYEKALYDRTSPKGNLWFVWSKRNRIIGIIKAFICSKEHLATKYPYAKKNAFFLTIAFFHRIFDGIMKLRSGKIRPFVLNVELHGKHTEVTQRRKKLFEELGIL